MSAVNPRRDSKTRTRMIHWLLVDFFFFFPVEHDKSWAMKSWFSAVRPLAGLQEYVLSH